MARAKDDSIEYFFSCLEVSIKAGNTPAAALIEAVEHYAYVYFTQEKRTPFSKAAELALRDMNGQSNFCEYKRSDDHNAWESSCHSQLFFGSGDESPLQNGLEFCPFCGRRMTESKEPSSKTVISDDAGDIVS